MGRRGSRASKARIVDRWTIDPKLVVCLYVCVREGSATIARRLSRRVGAYFDRRSGREYHIGPCRLQTLPGPVLPERHEPNRQDSACLDEYSRRTPTLGLSEREVFATAGRHRRRLPDYTTSARQHGSPPEAPGLVSEREAFASLDGTPFHRCAQPSLVVDGECVAVAQNASLASGATCSHDSHERTGQTPRPPLASQPVPE